MPSIHDEKTTAMRSSINSELSARMLILCCAVGAELGGPYITKTIIDKHLTTGDQTCGRA